MATIWTEYTRLAKGISSAAFFGSSIDRAIEQRRETLYAELVESPAELVAALEDLRETMASFEQTRDPDDIAG